MTRTLISAYVICGALAAAAGIVLAARATVGSPTAGQGLELSAITVVVIGGTSLLGGRGTLTGTLGGVLLLALIESSFTLLQLEATLTDLIRGVVILAAAALFVRRLRPMSVLGLGEALLRLSAPGRQRLEHAPQLEAAVGGAELNALITAASALGAPAAWVTRLADNPLGRRIAAHAAAHGVGAIVDWDEDARAPLYFVEHGAVPRPSEVLYDRDGTAMRDLEAGHVRLGGARRGPRRRAASGITCALGDGPAAAARALLAEAGEAGARTAFDVNHRDRLWSWEEAVPGAARRARARRRAARRPATTSSGSSAGRASRRSSRAAPPTRSATSSSCMRETATVAPGRVEVAVTAVTADAELVSPAYEAEVVDAFGARRRRARRAARRPAGRRGARGRDRPGGMGLRLPAHDARRRLARPPGRPAPARPVRAPGAAVIVDAHVHVFRPASVLPRAVDELAPAQRDAPVEDLLAAMVAAGVRARGARPARHRGRVRRLGARPTTPTASPRSRWPTTRWARRGDVDALDARRAGFPFHGVRTQWLGDRRCCRSHAAALRRWQSAAWCCGRT